MKNNKEVKEILGYKFSSDYDLGKQLGKSKSYVSFYRGKGLTYEEIIRRAEVPKEHTVSGYTFTSDKDLSRQLGMHDAYVGHFRRQGISYEEIIEKAENPTKTVMGYTFKWFKWTARSG